MARYVNGDDNVIVYIRTAEIVTVIKSVPTTKGHRGRVAGRTHHRGDPTLWASRHHRYAAYTEHIRGLQVFASYKWCLSRTQPILHCVPPSLP